MGAFFTNVHVRAEIGRESATQRAIVEALTGHAREAGLIVCDEPTPSDRTIIVGPPGRWIAVYDEATESQRFEALDELAALVSRAAAAQAVAALVHDSDDLRLCLFEGGKLVDEVRRGDQEKGDIAPWSKLCVTSTDELRAAFSRDDLLKEDTLREIAAALGIGDWICTGYNALEAEGAIPDGSTVLRFRAAVRPLYEQEVQGSPRFVMGSLNPRADLSIGQPFQVGAAVRNEGGASQGLLVALHGDAIDAGLVEPERVQLIVGRVTDHVFFEPSLSRRTASNGRPGFVGEVRELAIPPGNVGGEEALASLNPREYGRRLHVTQIHANVFGRALAPGSAQLVVTFVPLAAPEGQHHLGIAISVAATPYVPPPPRKRFVRPDKSGPG